MFDVTKYEKKSLEILFKQACVFFAIFNLKKGFKIEIL